MKYYVDEYLNILYEDRYNIYSFSAKDNSMQCFNKGHVCFEELSGKEFDEFVDAINYVRGMLIFQ